MRKEILKELLKSKLSIGLVGKMLEFDEKEIKNLEKVNSREDLINLIDNSSKNKKEKEKSYSLNDNKFYM